MTAPTLRELQSSFFDSIALRPGDHVYSADLTRSIASEPGIEPLARIGVYADAYWLRLLEVLVADFPILARVLGEDRFASAARDYLAAHPSAEPSVRFLGRTFAPFIECQDDLPAYCGAIARLEWAMNDVFDAADSGVIDAVELREFVAEEWPDVRFTPINAISILTEQWPIQRLWSGEDAGSLVQRETTICVWRARDYEVRHIALDACEAHGMKMMLAGDTFSRICAAYEALAPDEAAREVGIVLARWFARGIIAGLSIAPEQDP
jgi:hypothetical protein